MRAQIPLKKKDLCKSRGRANPSCLPFCGEDEIRTRGTLIRYVGLANRWFQPLTHLSVWPFSLKGCANIGAFLELTKFCAEKLALIYSLLISKLRMLTIGMQHHPLCNPTDCLSRFRIYTAAGDRCRKWRTINQ